MPSSTIGGENAILTHLSRRDRDALLRRGKDIVLNRADVLHDAHGTIKHVYFPRSGMVSLLTIMRDGDAVETGIVGSEGVVGGGIGNDGDQSFGQAIVQVAGAAWRVPAAAFREVYTDSSALRESVNHYQNYILSQAQQSAACHATHSVEARMCRWLLQSRDLLVSDTVDLTQEFLSHMLGVQRTTVSATARTLQEAGFIRYSRGRVQILNVEGLRDAACECYDAIRKETAKLRPR